MKTTVDNLETILGIIKCSEIIKSVEFEEHWENINCKKEPEEGSLVNEALGAENSDAMEPDSTTSVSKGDGDSRNGASKKDVSSGSASKYIFCDHRLTKDEYLTIELRGSRTSCRCCD